ncbi:Penicillin-binding protein 1A [Sinobacterium norvegicum]|uniref:Penicillin-binding protein 1A n=1 Tax=Sinobacterium norvegicum TaxID=1641715 RepID=A0ABM9AFH0_9GAMM|nr:penicillin-binding protein 1A [Sinobacterium norvegicum]CAH0991872.1 Penicillin-binding protein 1A [Sinobacterium norvegicum]
MPLPRSTLKLLLSLFVLFVSGTGLVLSAAFIYLSPQLPSPESLREVELKTPLRIYTQEGELIGEFGEERRIPINHQQIPPLFVKAILAAEDDGFYTHHGVDIKGLLRAASQLLMTGHIQSGGSTITMQVAKNYFLSHKRTFSRKFREILLAIQIERELNKDEILELYINKIFLGNRAYGIAAAAQVYYGKSISELNLAQLAMIAGLPKAPSAYNPLANPTRAQSRRDWILGRMKNLNYIDDDMYKEATRQAITASYHGSKVAVDSPYIAEMARQEMIELYGNNAYTDGYEVYTTVSGKLQIKAQEAMITGLKAYDNRHGYRGPEAQLEDISEESTSNALSSYRVIANMIPAAVIALEDNLATLRFRDNSEAVLSWSDSMSKLSPYLSVNSVGAKPKSLEEIIAVGDIIRVQKTASGYDITQRPNIEGAMIALSPHNGAIIALVGGFDFRQSNFNRALQAKRQPGSNFKPFVYAAALEHGLTPATIINDAPVVFDSAKLEDTWRPVNSSGNFYGPTRLRKALYSSRNLVSIRILRETGINKTIRYMNRFGFDSDAMPRDLSLALGSYALTPMELVKGYAILANGGYGVEPYLIERIEDDQQNILFSANPATVCRLPDCDIDTDNNNDQASDEAQSLEQILTTDSEAKLPNYAEQVIDARVAYLIDSMLMDVITKGTGRRALSLKRHDLAGKTGTTNGPTDAWFSGYNQDIVTTTWVGFDRYDNMGRREYGGSAALPIWIDFMSEALKGSESKNRQQPDGLVTVRIDPETGELASANQGNAIFETFRSENVPVRESNTGISNPVDLEEDLNLENDLFE